ncbi:hypothetical protein B9Q04_12015 [Candidatus Marsarchaeota G2 archaeon BE_D]|jgi:hypothetical protein|uniref:Uncharacterized protein n=3 Tax=Candidatus Marsarchaeota group 2 TaxID=2203771 RepID=A0A2R6C8J8_9ARCH|nr:MAG: hypothetical protein B9Q07_11645 [Candidatus Marsarchaeota G2 archaeon ECH_B_3]PSO01453.1 MAG: hypothetical protein B9Q05_08830 [Candidatus Marsarchaeota G2 archaeon ECH_B_1]PSO07225.1 MAG: hypothetical protein B9Q04_12015 [Candidatus Marsarchaeota G2 archaeon BE_D]
MSTGGWLLYLRFKLSETGACHRGTGVLSISTIGVPPKRDNNSPKAVWGSIDFVFRRTTVRGMRLLANPWS